MHGDLQRVSAWFYGSSDLTYLIEGDSGITLKEFLEESKDTGMRSAYYSLAVFGIIINQFLE